MAKKKSNGGAYGFGHIIILGIVTRVQRGKILGAVLNFFLFPLFWIVDIITVVLDNKLSLLA